MPEARRPFPIAALRDVLAGLALIALGFFLNRSILRGSTQPLDWVFDGLGLFCIVMGILRFVRR